MSSSSTTTTTNALDNLNTFGKKTGVKLGDLEQNKPYKIVEVKSLPSKFHPSRMQTIVHLENGFTLTLPSRFDDLSEDMYKYLQTQGPYLINKGPSGRSWILHFEEEPTPE